MSIVSADEIHHLLFGDTLVSSLLLGGHPYITSKHFCTFFWSHSPSMSAWIHYCSRKICYFLNLPAHEAFFPDVIYWWSLVRKCAAAKAKVKSFFPTILGACNAHWDARTRMYSTNLVFWYWLCAMFYVIWGNALRKWFKSCSYTHSAHRLIHTFGGSFKQLDALFRIPLDLM